MKRSRTQTLFKYLPGALFIHGDGFVAKVYEVEGRNFEADINREVLLEEIEREASRWPSERRHLSLPSELSTNDIRFLEPTFVRWDLYPLVFACRNPTCQRVRRFFRQDRVSIDTQGRARCQVCDSRLQQLRYVEAHNCGRIEPMFTPQCRTCRSYDHVYLRDTGSFVSAAWHCRRCGDQFVQKTRQSPCRCNDFVRAGRDRPFMRGFVARDHRLHRTLTVTVINLNHREYQELQRHPAKGDIAVAHYLEDVTSIAQALRDADRAAEGTSRQSPEEFEEKKRKWERALEQGLLDQDAFDQLVRDNEPKTRGVSAIASQVPERVLELGTGRGLTERAVLFDPEILPDRRPLAAAARQAADEGRALDAEAMQFAVARADSLGIADISVTLSFPITLAAYGFTRTAVGPENSSLSGFEYRNDPTVYGTATTTEALIVTLRAREILSWLAATGQVPGPVPDNERDARIELLTLHADEHPAAEQAALLVHSFSHAMLRGMGSGLAGFDESGLSEWLVPEAGTFAIYAASYQTFTLGALWTVLHHQAHDLLDTTEERARSCANDPLCHRRDPQACERCLYVTFGCSKWNSELSRSVLRSFWRHTAA